MDSGKKGSHLTLVAFPLACQAVESPILVYTNAVLPKHDTYGCITTVFSTLPVYPAVPRSTNILHASTSEYATHKIVSMAQYDTSYLIKATMEPSGIC